MIPRLQSNLMASCRHSVVGTLDDPQDKSNFVPCYFCTHRKMAIGLMLRVCRLMLRDRCRYFRIHRGPEALLEV